MLADPAKRYFQDRATHALLALEPSEVDAFRRDFGDDYAEITHEQAQYELGLLHAPKES